MVGDGTDELEDLVLDADDDLDDGIGEEELGEEPICFYVALVVSIRGSIEYDYCSLSSSSLIQARIFV